MAPLVSGVAGDATPLERALVDLVRRAHDAPALLTPADLEPLHAIAGDDALDYLLVLYAFHFITRIAELLARSIRRSRRLVIHTPIRRTISTRRSAGGSTSGGTASRSAIRVMK